MKVDDVQSQLLQKSDAELKFILPYQVQEEGIIISMETFRESKLKLVFYYILCVLSCGLLYLFLRWELKWRLALVFKRCSLIDSTHILIQSFEKELELVPIYEREARIDSQRRLHKMIDYRLYTYYLDVDIFKPIETKFHTMTNQQILDEYSQGVQDSTLIAEQYGYNNTTIPDKSTGKILVDEILSPFYIFQLFSVTLWTVEEYYPYALIIFLTSIFSIFITLRAARNNFIRLRSMTEIATIENLFRGGCDISIRDDLLQISPLVMQNNKSILNSRDIVPGDLIEVRDGWTVPCDCVLINGQCIINESMLTGESIPIIKGGLQYQNTIYSPQESSRQSTLFAGTKCIEARHPQKGTIPVLAIATQVGFATMKGQLVRSILFPKPSKFSFHADSMKFVAVLGFMALIGFLITLKDQLESFNNGDLVLKQFIINALDLITITVPPALPTCLSIGISLALGRLQKKQIYCISPNRVNIAGKVTIMCFDKTGTLTQDGLDLYGVRPVGYSQKKQKLCFQDLIVNMSDLQKFTGESYDLDNKASVYAQSHLAPRDLLLEIMACCHGLAQVKDELIGDPLEVKMFEATKAILNDLDSTVTVGETIIKITKRFDFSSTLQRMSVIISRNGKLRAHVKGSPEKLRELCLKDTIPPSFHKILDYYSKMGFRVLACGSKVLQSECSREQVECNLTFMGFMVMENKLKPATKNIIQTLQTACIRTIMVTGDNVLTAISVARQCHLVLPNQRIFLGDIAEDKKNGRNQIIWKDFEMSDNILNADNLSPQLDIEDDPDKDEDQGGGTDAWEVSKAKDRQTLEIQEVDPTENNRTSRGSRKQSEIKEFAFKQQERELREENLDHLVEDQDPWKTDDPFVIAISGKAFQLLLDQIETNPKARRVFGIMLERAQIFARMKPEQKACLITHLQKINRKALCGMCGDGANDCGALKAADVGVSLSDAEASIAAPFTSKVQDISCIIKLLREGRASLVTSFQCFKYMALYSMIQFTTVTLLYQVTSKLSTWQFTYIDLVIIVPLATTMGQTKSYKKLTQFQPGSNLISFPVLLSVIGQTFVQIAFQCIAFYTLANQSWYVTALEYHSAKGDQENYLNMQICFETTTVFLFTNFQYIGQCLAFSIGKPFRQPFYTNKPFTVWLVLMFIFNTYLLIWFEYPNKLLMDGLQLINVYKVEDPVKGSAIDTAIPQSWLILLLVLAVINLFITLTFERYAVPIVTRYYRAQKRKIVKRYRFPENPYLQ